MAENKTDKIVRQVPFRIEDDFKKQVEIEMLLGGQDSNWQGFLTQLVKVRGDAPAHFNDVSFDVDFIVARTKCDRLDGELQYPGPNPNAHQLLQRFIMEGNPNLVRGLITLMESHLASKAAEAAVPAKSKPPSRRRRAAG